MKKSFKELIENQQLNEFAITSDDSGQRSLGVDANVITEPLILGISTRTAPDYDTIMGSCNNTDNCQPPVTKSQPFIFGINDRSIPKFDD
jgi:hypothetical protein